MSMITIRPLQADDKADIMRILQNTPEFQPFEIPVAEELIDAFLKDGTGSGYEISVADFDRKVAGYVCYGKTPLTQGAWDIYWIAVDHNYQGKGIGKKLMATAENHLRQQGGYLIIVETSSKSAYNKTRQFYIDNGYQEAARIVGFYSKDDDKVIYQKRFEE